MNLFPQSGLSSIVLLCSLLCSIGLVRAQNQCTIDKVEIPQTPVNRVIFRFKCQSGTDLNPTIPVYGGSAQAEYNELDLSPNLYTELPVQQLCAFANIYYLDLSFNRITNMTNRYKQLSCLTQLVQFDLSNNLINTPMLDNDFDDIFPQRLEIFDLSNNQIPYVETALFIRLDGSARFPRLRQLNLANNQLKEFDILMPLILPSTQLDVDMSNNPIASIRNQLGRSFRNALFVNNVTGVTRRVNVRNHALTRLDDTNLLQYQITSETDFRHFLHKIENYDFRQVTNTLSCICPPVTGSYLVYWYANFSNTLTGKTEPIYNLLCSNIANRNIFAYNCTVSSSLSLSLSLLFLLPSCFSLSLFI